MNASRNPPRNATQVALGLLVRREHSRDELLRKLDARGFGVEEARVVLDKLASDGWQDDARFADALIRTRVGAGYGPLRIRAELGTHGLDRDAIAAALRGYEDGWIDNARELALRRFGPGLWVDRALQRKAAGFLYRRGFAADHVRAATASDTAA